MKKEDSLILSQISESLEKAEKKLEEAHEKKDSQKFNEVKKFMLNLQSKISEIIQSETEKTKLKKKK